MATLLELYGLQNNDDLLQRTAVAGVIAAEQIRTQDPGTPARRLWAARLLQDPKGHARPLLWAVLAANASATVAQITGASDATLVSAVQNAVALFTGD